eukprot:gnl/TRDRNA2_/TRDRNA2_123247_c0_seq2.p1 gnl/TRDRNA2_/TRDRNA2_123247_c0~~gnl/TRDRNA2_/TRDRNA2_123247_c0_seq2.p1  ORF type:complete len:212 (-),score=28.70 gnl/TRDRNA2_/TRDRNA2_123247_c0_seq2:694-1254(-)
MAGPENALAVETTSLLDAAKGKSSIDIPGVSDPESLQLFPAALSSSALQKTPNRLPLVDVIWFVTCHTAPGDNIVIVGSSEELGEWEPQKDLWLSTKTDMYPLWYGRSRLPVGRSTGFEWKIVLLRADGSTEWEPGHNRKMLLSEDPGREHAVVVQAVFGSGQETSQQVAKSSLFISPDIGLDSTS